MELKDFGRALHMMKNWNKVCNKWWNGLDKQQMYVEIQKPTQESKMNMPYLYMCVSVEWNPTTMRPWMPSMVDMFSEAWEVVN